MGNEERRYFIGALQEDMYRKLRTVERKMKKKIKKAFTVVILCPTS
jgi:hypothetical protein